MATLEKFEPLSDERLDSVLEMLHLWRVLIIANCFGKTIWYTIFLLSVFL